ncbi:hypothetical protein [Catenulispora subtropica]|uniref:B3/4 domain protein n=1 Tax=Catenulispora subtropica TaxID=450798 RepID=A0ABP5CAM4_9ACTN
MVTTQTEPLVTPNSYALVLPPGWIRVSLGGTVDAAVKDIADRMFARLPRDAYLERRREMEDLLREMVRQARATNGIDLYLPVEEMHGVTVSASFVVGGAALPDELDDIDTLGLLGAMAADGGLVEVDGSAGVRTERIQPPAADQPGATASRRVDYVFPIPGDTRRWLTVAFSTPGGGDPSDQVADVLVQLFDAMMCTFEWRTR